MSAVKGVEQPLIGMFIVEGIVTIIGLFVTRMLLFFVIV